MDFVKLPWGVKGGSPSEPLEAPGDGLLLQIVPLIRPIIPADGDPNFDNPVSGKSWELFGSGLVEGRTEVTFGGVWIEDNSISTLVDVFDGNFRQNGRLSLYVPERALAGPVRVQTAGGWFEVATVGKRAL